MTKKLNSTPTAFAKLIVLLLCLYPFPGNAQGCDCLAISSAKEALNNATLVAVADVLEKTKYSIPQVNKNYKELKVKLRVRKYWKGNPERITYVRTPYGDSNCGADLETGKTYLIYARGAFIPLFTNCSRTILASTTQGQADILQLGKVKYPD